MRISKALIGVCGIFLMMMSLGMIRGDGAQQSAKELYEAAAFKKDAAGDMEGAIKIFREIVERFPNNMAIAAKAQLQIGLCYEKLGQKNIKQAQDAFQKVVDNFPLQSEEVKIAKEKLSLLLKAQAVTKKDSEELRIRKIYDGNEVDVIGEISSDGRYISFPFWVTGGRLALYEIATGKKSFPKNKDGYGMVLSSTWSPDNKQVAYSWYNQELFWDLRIIGLSGSEPRVLYKDENAFVHPTDWSPDGKFISVYLTRNNSKFSQVGQVSVEDGSYNNLKTLDYVLGSGGGYMKYSPDGRYLAYDLSPKGVWEREIFTLSSDGKKESSLIQHPADDYLLSWTPDGKNILFVSDRMGTQDLWIIATEEGKPKGTPSRIKPNIGNIYPLGFTQSGQFYYGIRKGLRDVYLADLDLDKGALLSSPARVIKRHLGTNTSPEWSPDGKFMAYVSTGRGMISLRILSLETGEEREILRPDLQRIAGVSLGLHWSPDGRSLLTIGYDQENNQDAYIFDVETDTMTVVKLEMLGEKLAHPAWSKDGKTIFYLGKSWKKRIFRFMAHNIEKGESKEFARDSGNPVWMSISPDGQWLAYATYDKNQKAYVLQMLPVTGGEPRTVAKIPGADCSAITWSPDGKFILYSVINKEKERELLKVSPEGGQPQRITGPVSNNTFSEMRIHPDGSRIAFSSEDMRYEIWVMENFLPKLIDKN